MMKTYENQSLIVIIVKKGHGSKLIEASLEAGAGGATVMYGRGVRAHEKHKFMGIPIEPEKEVFMSVVPRDKAVSILDDIIEKAELDKHESGIGFIVPVENVVGTSH